MGAITSSVMPGLSFSTSSVLARPLSTFFTAMRQRSVIQRAAADAVAAPELLPVHMQLHGEVLPVDEAEFLL